MRFKKKVLVCIQPYTASERATVIAPVNEYRCIVSYKSTLVKLKKIKANIGSKKHWPRIMNTNLLEIQDSMISHTEGALFEKKNYCAITFTGMWVVFNIAVVLNVQNLIVLGVHT